MEHLNKNQINRVAQILKNGGLVAFPTETVFGLGVVFDNPDSYKRLIEVKRRPPEKPFTLMLSNPKDIEKYAHVDEKAKALIEAFVPGQITLILRAKDGLPSYVVSKDGFVGVRIPDNRLIQDLIDRVGKPLLVPSANKSGEIPATSDNEVAMVFESEIDAVIEGKSVSNVPSTIARIDNDVEIIREGLIKKEDIDKILAR